MIQLPDQEKQVAEALRLISIFRETLDRESWEQLERYVDEQVYSEFVLAPGAKFALESTAMWDDRPGGAIRFVVDLLQLKPERGASSRFATATFLKWPDGRLEDA